MLLLNFSLLVAAMERQAALIASKSVSFSLLLSERMCRSRLRCHVTDFFFFCFPQSLACHEYNEVLHKDAASLIIKV